MLTLFGNVDSGNVHKVQMILSRLRLPFRRVDVRQDRGQPHDARFLAINPMGKVPAVRLLDGDILSDSGAILFYFSFGTPLWPDVRRDQAEVLRWMFFEQYSHEPVLAVLRYLKRYTPDPEVHRDRIHELSSKSAFVLGVLEKRLAEAQWVAGPSLTIADYALYPYTRWMDEVGFALEDWRTIKLWINRFESLPGFLPLYADAATEVIEFADYFGPLGATTPADRPD
jgi:glutathione S-transferase